MTEDLHHLSAACALDAVKLDEARRFEAHIATCERCAAEVREFRATAARLAAASVVTPPPGLRERVLNEAAATRQRSPLVLTAVPRRSLAPLLAAAVLLVVLGGVGPMVRDLAAERHQVRELTAVLAALDARSVPLEGAERATLRVVWSPSAQGAVVVGAGLEDPGPGRVYELWTIGDGGPRSAGLFEPGPDGRVERRLALPENPSGGWGVTIEPDGGSPRPTGDILFLGA